MQASNVVDSMVSLERVASWRPRLLLLAALAGVGAALFVAVAEPVADFLGEGPVRALGLEGGARRGVIVAGALLATAAAVWGAWSLSGAARAVLVLGGLGLGLALANALLVPMAGLVLAAVGLEVLSGVPRERLEGFAPRRRPLAWVAAAPFLLAGAAAGVWLSLYLVQPLFDQGTELDEALSFAVATSTAAAGTDGMDSGGGQTGAASDAGVLVAQGELMGADSFHTGEGRVLIVEGPDGLGTLRFEDYSVRNGPDLHVYLTPDEGGDVHTDGAIDLGAVRATRGNVNYEIPEGVDLSSFRGAVIYCEPFSVVFASATLASP